MAVKGRAVSVTNAATALSSTPTDSQSGATVAVYNNSDATIYIGGSDVTTSIGAPVAAGTWGPALDLDNGETLYGIVASGTKEARVVERGV